MQTYSSAQSHQKYLSAAVKCQTQLSAIAEEGSLTQRYCLVLEELRKEAVKGSDIPQLDFCTGASNENALLQRELIQQEMIADDNSAAMQHDTQEEDMADATSLRTTLGSSIYDIPGWGAFDSMVSYVAISRSTCCGGADPVLGYVWLWEYGRSSWQRILLLREVCELVRIRIAGRAQQLLEFALSVGKQKLGAGCRST